MRKTFMTISVLLLLSACGGETADGPPEETVGGEIADGYNRQLEKASEVELQLEAQKRDLDAAIEDSEQG